MNSTHQKIHSPTRSKAKKRLAFGSKVSMCTDVRGGKNTARMTYAPGVAPHWGSRQ